MREIKFRTWSKVGQQIIEWDTLRGSLLKLLDDPNYPMMQFTGMLDRNGSEIYEGDILKREYDFGVGSPHIELHVVVFQNGCFGEENDEGQFLPISVFDILPEVIGNVYQNPDRK